MAVDGIVSVWKDAGMTSHDVVSKMRKLFGQKRIGHAGTLDPQVTGVLLVCLGQATRLVERLQSQSKIYSADVMFGKSTDTEDLQGEVIQQIDSVSVHQSVNESSWKQSLQTFLGEQQQVPPMVSAVRVNGKRLYEYAREGQIIERKSRQIKIYRIEANAWHISEIGFPIGSFEVECSKGTYVRTICTDMGARFGIPAVMSHLVRTGYGRFSKSDSFSLEQLNDLKLEGRLEESVVSITKALQGWRFAKVNDPARMKWVRNGGSLLSDEWSEVIPESLPNEGEFALLDSFNQVVGIYQWNESKQAWKPDVIFQTELNESLEVVET